MTPHQHTLGELVDFATHNRRGKAFYGWTRQDITNAFLDSLQEGTLLYSVDSQGTINGVVHASKFMSDKVLFVGNILAVGDSSILRGFIQRFKMLFPDYNLEAERHGRRKVYKTARLVELLT